MSENQSPMPQNVPSKGLTSEGNIQAKFLASVFGVMFLALAATAAVCFGFTFLFRSLYGTADGGITAEGYNILLWTLIGSMLFLLVYSIVASFVAKSGKGLIPLYIVYIVVMGLFFSSFMVFDVAWPVMGEALGISALAFLVMFAIGYFSKANLHWLALLAIGLLVGACFMSLLFALWFVIAGYIEWFDVLISGIVLVSVMLLTAVSANRMKRVLTSGGYPGTSMVLYFAFDLYVNFINILIRVFYLLLVSKSK